MLFDKLNFDLLITSSEYLDMSRQDEFPRARLSQARTAEGVDDAIPLLFGVGGWRLPSQRGLFGTTSGGAVMSINVIGVPPGQTDRAFRVGPDGAFPSHEEARNRGALLGRLDAFLFDRLSKPEFGDARDLVAASSNESSGDQIRLNGQRAAIVGEFDLGTGFSWNGMLMSSEETYYRFMLRPSDRINFGLVQLAPGADPLAVQRELRSVLPPDVRVYTREEINAAERRYWLRVTSVGQFLIVAVILAVVVGVIFVYQMMAADIRNMLPEFATVKALGYRPPFLTGVVLWQAILLAILGYLPGSSRRSGSIRRATVRRNSDRHDGNDALGVLVLTAGMCRVRLSRCESSLRGPGGFVLN